LDDGAGKVPGFPSQIGTREQLADIVRRIIWTAGPQHAAVNFPDTEYMAFVPHAPGATYTAPVDGDVDEAAILRLLPPKDQTGVQVQTSFALAGYHYDQLLDYQLNTTDGSQAVVTKYYNLLQTQVRNLIEERNKQRGEQQGLLVYPYFLPENIPNSTSV
jgi:arachidonate 15-lipoxygenase